MKYILLLIAISLSLTYCQWGVKKVHHSFKYQVNDIDTLLSIVNSTCIHQKYKDYYNYVVFGTWNYNEPLPEVLDYIFNVKEGIDAFFQIFNYQTTHGLEVFDKPLPITEPVRQVCVEMIRTQWSRPINRLYANVIIPKDISQIERDAYFDWMADFENECRSYDNSKFWQMSLNDYNIYKKHLQNKYPNIEPWGIIIKQYYIQGTENELSVDPSDPLQFDFSNSFDLSKTKNIVGYNAQQYKKIFNEKEGSNPTDVILKGGKSDQDYCDFLDTLLKKQGNMRRI